MSKDKLTRDEIEDREDYEKINRILDDPDTEWVEWRELDAELLRRRQQEYTEGDSKIAETATGTG